MSFAVTAEAYGRFMGRFSEPLAPAFISAAGIEAGMRVLDVGSGPGALTSALVDAVGVDQVAAVDPQPLFLEALQERLPGVVASVASAERLPFDDSAFDATLSQLVVLFMSDPVAGVREMARVTRPGGIVAATVWQPHTGTGPLSPFWAGVRSIDPQAPDQSALPTTGPGELAELFATAGLPASESSSLAVSVSFGSFEEWWEPFTLGVGPAGDYLSAQSPDRRAAIRDACAAHLGPAPFMVTGSASCVVATR